MPQHLRDLETKLAVTDLEWISDFERAVVYVANEVGITPTASPSEIDRKIVAAITPVLINAQNSNSSFQPPSKMQTVERLRELIKGGMAFLKGKSETFSKMWSSGEIDIESAKIFSQMMFKNSTAPAYIHCARQAFKDLKSLVDLGGGGGGWAVEAVKYYPELKFTIFDLDNVNRATKDIVTKEIPEASHRVSYISGNFFNDPLPASEAYLLSNILHDWPPNVCRELLQRISKQVPQGSSLFIHECLLDDDKMGPRFTTLFNLLMMLNHSSQQFTYAELVAILKDSGFTKPTIVSTAAHYSLLKCERV